MDPHDYIRLRRMSTTTTSTISAVTTEKKPKPKNGRRGRVGRPRKTTLFPQVKEAANKSKKRMKWDSGMNRFIMYTYYYVTRLETDKNQYRKKLRDKFLEAYPVWESITEQRLADQMRSIRQNRLINVETLRELKRAVRAELEKEGIVLGAVEEDSRDKSFYD